MVATRLIKFEDDNALWVVFIIVTLQRSATPQFSSDKAETFFPGFYHINVLVVLSDLQSEDIFSRGWRLEKIR